MDPKPDHGETSYQGFGRLAGRRAAITGALAKQVGEKGIRVNAVAPDPVGTPLQTSGGQPQVKSRTSAPGCRRPTARPGAALFVDSGHVLDLVTRGRLADLTGRCANLWRSRDLGIWQLGQPEHYTMSKMGFWTRRYCSRPGSASSGAIGWHPCGTPCAVSRAAGRWRTATPGWSARKAPSSPVGSSWSRRLHCWMTSPRRCGRWTRY